jgi:hypothetical protein
MLSVDSGLTDEVISARGYWTATTNAELRRHGFKSPEIIAPALMVPLHGPSGPLQLYQCRPDSPRVLNGKPRKYETQNGVSPQLDIPPTMRHLVGDPAVPMWFTEGSKKADAAAIKGILCASFSGVDNFRGKNDQRGITIIAALLEVALKGRRVYIAYDSDAWSNPNVCRAARQLGEWLEYRGAEVYYLNLPSPDGRKVGLDDFFASGGTVAQALQSATKTPPGGPAAAPVKADSSTIITNNREMRDVRRDAIQALASKLPPITFVRDGELVYVYTDEHHGLSLRGHHRTSMQRALSDVANWVAERGGDDGHRVVTPPLDVCDSILALDCAPDGIPALKGIAYAPIVTDDGVVSEFGYHSDSKWYMGARMAPVPFQGTAKEAAEWILDEILCDFPFQDSPSKTNALAMFLLPYFRASIDGPTPLHFIDAPGPGNGKSKLVEACLRAGFGSDLSTLSMGKDDDELDKAVTAALLAGVPAIWLDNVGRFLASDKIESAITEERVLLRPLGSASLRPIRPRCVWALTCNNGRVKDDFLRRSAYIRLNAKMENPHERKFRHPDIVQWVMNNRAQIWGAVITIAEAWIEAGRPRAKGKKNNSFAKWFGVIGGVLEMLGYDDLMTNSSLMSQNIGKAVDDVAPLAEAVIEAYGEEPVLLKEILTVVNDKELLGSVVGDGGPRAQSTKLGVWLGRRHETVSDGYLVERFTPLKGMTRFKFSKILVEGEPLEPLPPPRAREERENLSHEVPIAPIPRFPNVHPDGQFEPSGGVNVGGGSPQNADEGEEL